MSEEAPRYATTSPDDDGNFEIRLRLLGNEVFAISISADPLDKKWVSWALIICFVTIIGLGVFGKPLSNFYSSLVNAHNDVESVTTTTTTTEIE